MDSASQILDISERRMRQMGYNAVSYREIAAEIGIKSASVHYHFPKKEDLGVAVVRRYSQNFRAQLDKRTSTTKEARDMVAAFVDIYRFALNSQGLVCLCAVLGAEARSLPKAVASEVREFFNQNIRWLTQVYREIGLDKPLEKAKSTLSLLEGSMIVSSVKNDNSVFEASTNWIGESLMRFEN